MKRFKAINFRTTASFALLGLCLSASAIAADPASTFQSGVQAASGYASQSAKTMAGATVPGVPVVSANDQQDSVGSNEALPGIANTSCPTGQVFSGGTCVPLTTLLPADPTCPYGQVLSGGSCISLPTTPTNCASGTVLSGGVCVPLTSTPAPTCPASPATTQSLACPSGQTGLINQSRTATCNASTGYAWNTGVWTTTSNTCVSAAVACPSYNEPTATQTLYTCPSGKTGSYVQSRSVSCNTSTGVWSAGSWYTTSDNCVATSTACPSSTKPTTTQTLYSCPSGQTGSYVQSRSVTCNTTNGTWTTGSWYTSTNNCVAASVACPSSTKPSTTQSTACPSPQTGTISQSRTVTCNTTNGTWTSGSWTTLSSTCANPPAPAECPAGSGTFPWGTGSACSWTGSYPKTASGGTFTMTNQASTASSGSTIFRCNGTTWGVESQSCVPKPKDCAAKTVTATCPPLSSSAFYQFGKCVSSKTFSAALNAQANGAVSYTSMGFRLRFGNQLLIVAHK